MSATSVKRRRALNPLTAPVEDGDSRSAAEWQARNGYMAPGR